MDDDEGCIHFPDDPNAVCSICKPKPPQDDPTFDLGLRAMYYGKCSNCGGSIYKGDFIVVREGKWVHDGGCKGST